MNINEYIENCRKIIGKLGRYDEYYDGISKISCVIPFEDQTKSYDGGPYRVHGEMWNLEDHILNITKHL